MSAVLGTIRDGQVMLDAAAPWPEGKRVKVNEIEKPEGEPFMTEAEWRTDPEGIREWLDWYRSLEPIFQSDEEIARIEREIKDFGKHSLITEQNIDDFIP